MDNIARNTKSIFNEKPECQVLPEGCTQIRFVFRFGERITITNSKYTFLDFFVVMASVLVFVRIIYSFMGWFFMFNRYKNYLGTRIRRHQRTKAKLRDLEEKIKI